MRFAGQAEPLLAVFRGFGCHGKDRPLADSATGQDHYAVSPAVAAAVQSTREMPSTMHTHIYNDHLHIETSFI